MAVKITGFRDNLTFTSTNLPGTGTISPLFYFFVLLLKKIYTNKKKEYYTKTSLNYLSSHVIIFFVSLLVLA